MKRKRKEFNGELVSKILNDRGITDTEAGARCGVSSQSVSNYRNGREPRSYATLCALANLLGVQTHELFREVK